MFEHNPVNDSVGAGIARQGSIAELIVMPSFAFVLECLDRHGKLKWRERFKNTVMTGGKNDLLDKYFSGSGYTAAFYFMLISLTSYTTGPAVGDTMGAHGGWAEDVTYSNANRPAIAFASASAGAKATASASAFNINGTTTIKGAAVATNNTKGGTSGVLYSGGLFGSGDRLVNNLDTLNVTGSWSS